MPEAPRHRRPVLVGDARFDAITGDIDPALRSEAADRCATLLVRGARDAEETAIVDRVVRLADTEGLDEIAELWAGAPPDSLAGCLWRLYLLRSWVYADPARAAREFDRGRHHVPVSEVVAGVTDPPRPEDVKRLADAVLRGIRVGEFADTLFRASAFARVTAAGRAHSDHLDDDHHAVEPGDGHRPGSTPGSTYASGLSASRLLTTAEQLESAGRLELQGKLA